MDAKQLATLQQQRSASALPVVETAVVLTAAPDPLTATTSGGVETVTAVLGLTLYVDDTVLIARVAGQVLAFATLNGGTPPVLPPDTLPVPKPLPPTPTPMPPQPVTGVSAFPAVYAGSYRNGGWRTDQSTVTQGTFGTYGTNHGAWIYGVAPGATLYGASITKCEIRVSRRSGGVYSTQQVHFYRHGSSGRPDNAPALLEGPSDEGLDIGESEWVELPASWGQSIVDGGGGIAIDGEPYVNLIGRDADSQSGLLRLTWRR